ncbi:40S ribosomal protein S2 [Pteropus alecto]|uniref:Small ribosomal subunit protein uS5 n=1 Tax=Pteropus alecto TaxID=9402 RepID=L5JW01_PTEAL|nr:40S ribosomal protein S2 [Pteropus alecto]
MAFRTKWENNGLEVTLSCKESNNVVLSPTAMVHGRLGCLIEEGTRKAASWRESQVPLRVTGRCGSVLVHLIPFLRGNGIVSAPVPKKLLMMAGIDDYYTSARGCTATLGNFAKATFDAICKTYSYLNRDLWKETMFTKSLYQEFTDHLVKTHTRVSVQRTQAPAVATT